jgi:hypothetical protein
MVDDDCILCECVRPHHNGAVFAEFSKVTAEHLPNYVANLKCCIAKKGAS